MKKMRPFFCYYGGKYRVAPKYAPPKYDTIVEPFAGAAGYSTRYADHNVVLIERDATIAALWRYLMRVTSSEIRAIPLLRGDQTVDDLPVCEEARSLVGFWLNKGSATPKRSPSSRFKGGTRPNSHWGDVVREIIAGQVDRIRHWRLVEGSYVDFPSSTLSATWFVDPPYRNAGVYYRCSAKAIDFTHLGAWCRSLRGQTIVCENEGADWLPFKSFTTTRTTGHHKGAASLSAEVVWENDSTTST